MPALFRLSDFRLAGVGIFQAPAREDRRRQVRGEGTVYPALNPGKIALKKTVSSPEGFSGGKQT